MRFKFELNHSDNCPLRKLKIDRSIRFDVDVYVKISFLVSALFFLGERFMKKLTCMLVAGAALTFSTSLALADPIVGNWKTQSGETAAISSCGGSFCITLKSGQHSGKRIGKFKGAAGDYAGTITDPSDNKKYSGTVKLSGSSMKLKGCALKVFCKTQSWKKL